MAKSQYPIMRFEGGINSAFDERDIEEQYLTEATNVCLTTVGKLKKGGASVRLNSFDEALQGVTSEANFQSGYGLFSYGSDYDIGFTKSMNTAFDKWKPQPKYTMEVI